MELYVHIPFCVRKCRYCDFVSFQAEKSVMSDYIRNLLLEAEKSNQENQFPEIETVYIGGGTPSLLPDDLTRRLWEGLRSVFKIQPDAEITVEANPGTVREEWLDICLSNGVNRFSLGMQAAQAHVLELLGRIHRLNEVEKTVSLFQKKNIRNYNLDLMFGIPQQTKQDWSDTLSVALSMGPSHLSCYGLIPEEGTPIKKDLDEGRLLLPESEEEREMYYMTKDVLLTNGYVQYEVSNFSRPGMECKHNIGYWTMKPYIGLGLAAASMSKIQRMSDGIRYFRKSNPIGFDDYEKYVRNEPVQLECELIDSAEARFETVMLGLRMTQGVNDQFFKSLHGVTLSDTYPRVLEELKKRGLMYFEDGSWKLTDTGMDIQNTVLVEFMQ